MSFGQLAQYLKEALNNTGDSETTPQRDPRS
jgi:hypothetical protein